MKQKSLCSFLLFLMFGNSYRKEDRFLWARINLLSSVTDLGSKHTWEITSSVLQTVSQTYLLKCMFCKICGWNHNSSYEGTKFKAQTQLITALQQQRGYLKNMIDKNDQKGILLWSGMAIPKQQLNRTLQMPADITHLSASWIVICKCLWNFKKKPWQSLIIVLALDLTNFTSSITLNLQGSTTDIYAYWSISSFFISRQYLRLFLKILFPMMMKQS